MHNERFRRMTGVTGAMLCLIAATSYAQDTTVTTPPPTVPEVRTGTAGGPPFDTTAMASPMGMVDTQATEEGDDGDFPWGLLGLLGLLGLFKRGGTTVVTRDAYTSPPSGTRPGSSPRTPPDDRTMNLNPRPGEGGGGTDPRR